MRRIEGTILTAIYPPNEHFFFGPQTRNQEFSIENITTNGLIPFVSPEEAIKFLDELKKKADKTGLTNLGLAEIQMEITKDDDEIRLLEHNRNLIVVAEIEGGVLLLGKPMNGIPGINHAPVSDLLLNDLTVIDQFDPKFNGFGGALYEVRRQGCPKAWLGTFTLLKISLQT